MVNTDRSPSGIVGDYSRTRTHDSIICLCKHTDDGKIYYRDPARIQGLSKEGICSEDIAPKMIDSGAC